MFNSAPHETFFKVIVAWISPGRFRSSKASLYELVERQNLTMRMSMRRFMRLTNAHSKKLENHGHAIAIHYIYYNFAQINSSLRVTPAMETVSPGRPMTPPTLASASDCIDASIVAVCVLG